VKSIWMGLLALGLALILGAGADARPKWKGAKVRVLAPGETFCVSDRLVTLNGRIVIQEGRCYRLAILRSREGTFLAFLDPAVRIPPGQLVRLSTPAGPKLRGRIFYLVPVQAVTVIPVDTIVLVPVRVEDLGPSLVVVVTNSSLPRITVRFEVRL
jgi:hypothetical protein